MALSAKSKPNRLILYAEVAYNRQQSPLCIAHNTQPCRTDYISGNMKIERSTRVALIYYGHIQHKKVLQLVENIANETLVLSPECAGESLSRAVADCDLIVIAAQRHLTPIQRQAIHWIRAGSLAPIVVLIGEKHTEETVDIINCGADAAIPLNLTTAVIVAHCQALMRRWRADPYVTPKFA